MNSRTCLRKKKCVQEKDCDDKSVTSIKQNQPDVKLPQTFTQANHKRWSMQSTRRELTQSPIVKHVSASASVSSSSSPLLSLRMPCPGSKSEFFTTHWFHLPSSPPGCDHRSCPTCGYWALEMHWHSQSKRPFNLNLNNHMWLMATILDAQLRMKPSLWHPSPILDCLLGLSTWMLKSVSMSNFPASPWKTAHRQYPSSWWGQNKNLDPF